MAGREALMADNPKHKDKKDSGSFSKGKKEAPRKTVKQDVNTKTGRRKG
jgi:hypothetical protein